MNTNNVVMFPNYMPEGVCAQSVILPINIQEKQQQVMNKIGNDVFLILHDCETEPENNISKFLTKIKTKYKDTAEESDIFQAMNRYNLVDIFNEIHDNLYYVGNNKAQLELIEKFDISSFERLYQIVDTIGMGHSLHWKHIHMPVDKFSLLTQYVDFYHTKYFTQEDYLLMAQDLEYKNMEGLYSGINALNLAEGIHRIDFSYDDTVHILLSTHNYINKNMDGEDVLSHTDLKVIYEIYYDQKQSHVQTHSYSSVKRLLLMFGYKFDNNEIVGNVA